MVPQDQMWLLPGRRGGACLRGRHRHALVAPRLVLRAPARPLPRAPNGQAQGAQSRLRRARARRGRGRRARRRSPKAENDRLAPLPRRPRSGFECDAVAAARHVRAGQANGAGVLGQPLPGVPAAEVLRREEARKPAERPLRLWRRRRARDRSTRVRGRLLRKAGAAQRHVERVNGRVGTGGYRDGVRPRAQALARGAPKPLAPWERLSRRPQRVGVGSIDRGGATGLLRPRVPNLFDPLRPRRLLPEFVNFRRLRSTSVLG
mmetsp:Transcript_1594/g.4646  ORF Transcript_1594/g.4646 Transcript_1594/m.4646 type:complete len:262 (+) Transcript_1594:114-899(+)